MSNEIEHSKSVEYEEIKYKYTLSWTYSMHLNSVCDKDIIHKDNIFNPDGYFAWMHDSNALVMHSGYSWDGASGPTIDTASTMRGSLVHDCLYQMIREGLIDMKHRKYADKVMKRIMKEDGMPWWRASYFYWGVRLFGKKAATKKD